MDEHLIHLADDDNTDAIGRGLLSAGQSERMPASSRSAVAAGLGITAAAASAVAGAGTASSGIGLLAKLVLLTTAFLGLAATGYVVLRSQAEPVMTSSPAASTTFSAPLPASVPPVAAPVVATTQSLADSPQVAPPSVREPFAPAIGSNDRKPTKPKPATVKVENSLSEAERKSSAIQPVSPTTSGLAQEIATIDRAQQALSAGHFAVASQVIATYMTAFPRGTLRAEAAALQFDIAVAQGNKAAATLGNAFLQHFPGSPQRQRISNQLNRLQLAQPMAAP
jgi:TolA-binding protein